MKRALMAAAVAVATVAASGCAVLRVTADTDKPVLLNNPAKVSTKQHFKTDGVQTFLFWGLVGNDNKAINDAVLKEAANARGIVNLKVSKHYSFLDLVVSTVTLGIVGPRSFTIEGDKY